ncbi:MAG TPA: zinc-finger domain-containing protein [Gammaproteobacteria bacterium]
MSSSASTPNAQQQVTVRRDQLPIHCPMPGTTLWNSHPRVYIPLEDSTSGKALCPYCGTEYVLSR